MMKLHHHFLQTCLPYGVTMELGQYRWFRKLFGGHWEYRVYSSGVVPGGSIEHHRWWVQSEECWSDREVFSGDYGVSIEKCEDHV